jgi:hypothetical protein
VSDWVVLVHVVNHSQGTDIDDSYREVRKYLKRCHATYGEDGS